MGVSSVSKCLDPMARHATIFGRKGSALSHIAIGTSDEMSQKFKHDSFQGFDQVWKLDTSGGHKRKRGGGSKAAPKKKTLEKGK